MPTINNNSNKLVTKKIWQEFNSLVAEEELSELITISILE